MGSVVEFESHQVRSVYLDANAATPLVAEVFDAMMPWHFSRCGNASSSHLRGREVRAALETARFQVADLVSAQAGEIVFTSGGTEADNLAIFGTAVEPGAHVITSAIEHHAVLHAIERLRARLGWTVTYLTPNENGAVRPEDVARAIRRKTRLISVMMANNETGVLQPVEEIGSIARERGILFHTDAVQAAGKVSIDVKKIGCDLLSLSAHKMHGPQGVGTLYVREGIKLDPMVVGGGQGPRISPAPWGSGWLPRSLAKALETGASSEWKSCGTNWSAACCARPSVPASTVRGHSAFRTQPTSGSREPEGGQLIHLLDRMGVAVSGGSACNAGSCAPSHVLLAMGLSPARASASVRFSLHKQTTIQDVGFAIWQVAEALERLRAHTNFSPDRRSVSLPQNV